MDIALKEGGIHMAEFGKYLKSVREKRGLGVNQLATMAGISPSLVSRVENGKRGAPKYSSLEDLSRILKVPQIEMLFMAGYTELIQVDPDMEFSEAAYKFMTEEDLEIIKNYRKSTYKYHDNVRKELKEPPENIIGERIKRLADKRKISYEKLAEDLNINPANFYNMENGNFRPDYHLINRIADYFNVSTDYLLGRSENPNLINYNKNDNKDSPSWGDQAEFEAWVNDPSVDKFYREFKESPEERKKALLAVWEILKTQGK